jgi:two-component system NarL family response regulator
MTTIRVLVADDFPLMRDGMACSLQHDPSIEVVGVAGDGDTALALARELEPDVIVLDLRMPGVSGPGLVHRLTAELPKTRILMVTASDSPENLFDCVAAGAAGYLSKHVGGEELRQAVITTHTGGSVLASHLAAQLMREYSASRRGEGSASGPLLNSREMEIVRLVSQGLTDVEIGAQVFFSPRTVQNHLTNIRDKTGLRRRSELARWAVEHAVA